MWIAGGSVCMISSIITFIVSHIGYTHAHRKEIAEAACMHGNYRIQYLQSCIEQACSYGSEKVIGKNCIIDTHGMSL